MEFKKSKLLNLEGFIYTFHHEEKLQLYIISLVLSQVMVAIPAWLGPRLIPNKCIKMFYPLINVSKCLMYIQVHGQIPKNISARTLFVSIKSLEDWNISLKNIKKKKSHCCLRIIPSHLGINIQFTARQLARCRPVQFTPNSYLKQRKREKKKVTNDSNILS